MSGERQQPQDIFFLNGEAPPVLLRRIKEQ